MVLGMILFYILNYFILERLLIPDPCYYHAHDTTTIFNLFYQLTGEEGFHPSPTSLNYVITLTAGALVGRVIGKRRIT